MTRTRDYRIGHGFDVHRFRRGRRLMLGGIEIPSAFGLAGHSDADVLLHALIDALLGAAGMGDIGTHFPAGDPRYKGISSAKLLARVLRLIRRSRFSLINGDLTAIAEKPRLAPFFKPIRANVARLLGVAESRINIKAVSTEGLGWVGEGKGMAAAAVVLLEKRRKR